LQLMDSDRLEDKLMVAAENGLGFAENTERLLAPVESEKKVWIIFLRDVIVVQNMLLIEGVDSLQKAYSLRLMVLRELIDTDLENKTPYQEEVRDITFKISVSDGIRHVNNSRLYVNIPGLMKWASEHCMDGYERYKELVLGEVLAGNTLPILPKYSSSGQSFLEQIALLPITETDDHLLRLLLKIRTAYLSDPRNGLDAFISLRVRHGSLAGTLSRALDSKRLLILRTGVSGCYENPNHWLEVFSLGRDLDSDIKQLFERFTISFYFLIDDLLKNRLIVRSEKDPGGMIVLEVTDYFVKGLKFDLVNGMTFDSFLSAVFLSYKNSISHYLEELRRYLKDEFLSAVMVALDVLCRDVSMIILDPVLIGKFNDAVTNSRTELQSSIRTVCGWLEIDQKEDLAQLFTLQQATRIAMEYTKQVRIGFSPKLSENYNEDGLKITSGSLMVIVDILFILLDNVCLHAGNPNQRTVRLSFDLVEVGVMRIEMENDIDPAIDQNEVGSRVDAARGLLLGGESEKMLTIEGKSGLPKLGKLALQDRDDALQFKLEGGKFLISLLIGYSEFGSLQ